MRKMNNYKHMKKSDRKFLHRPEYPGGNESFKAFIKEHLVYPKQALENKIHGTVYLQAEINDEGEVLQVKVDNGIGFGCDEEAVRSVKMMHSGKVKNREVRLKAWKKLRINFRLDEHKPKEFSYNYSVKSDKERKSASGTSYQYTIQLPPKK